MEKLREAEQLLNDEIEKLQDDSPAPDVNYTKEQIRMMIKKFMRKNSTGKQPKRNAVSMKKSKRKSQKKARKNNRTK